jgi:hypothetical protein
MQVEWEKSRGIFLTTLAVNQVATWIVLTVARGAMILDLAGVARTIVLFVALGALFTRSRKFEWLAATMVLALAIARISIQAIR